MIATIVPEASSLDLAVGRLASELRQWHVPGVQLAVVRDGTVLDAGSVQYVGGPHQIPKLQWERTKTDAPL
jgi:hypothetical protein